MNTLESFYTLLIFDKDGTLVTPKQGKFTSYKNQQLFPSMKEAITQYQSVVELLNETLQDKEKIELSFSITTNQGGVAYPLANLDHPRYKDLGHLIDELLECNQMYRGLFDNILAAVGYPKEHNNWLLEICLRDGSPFIKLVNFDDGYATFRKPGTGMIQRIKWSTLNKVSASNTLFIGDSEEDRLAALKMGIDHITPQEFIQWVDQLWEENFSSQDTSNGVWSNQEE